MKTAFIEPHASLKPFVARYLVVEDHASHFAYKPVKTCPEPLAVLSRNFGRGSIGEDGQAHPRAALLGLQTEVRTWLPQEETAFVAIFLKVPGLISLFPHLGSVTANRLVPLDEVWSPRDVRRFLSCIPSNCDVHKTKDALDHFLASWLEEVHQVHSQRSQLLYESLVRNRNALQAAIETGISTRTLQRFFSQNAGISARDLLNIHRIQSSVLEIQEESENKHAGYRFFSDQAHRGRSWQRFLKTTPVHYRKHGMSELATRLVGEPSEATDRPVFWL